MIIAIGSKSLKELMDQNKMIVVKDKDGNVLGLCMLVDTEKRIAYRYNTLLGDNKDFPIERYDDITWEIVDF